MCSMCFFFGVQMQAEGEFFENINVSTTVLVPIDIAMQSCKGREAECEGLGGRNQC